jgi:hypothetical protein
MQDRKQPNGTYSCPTCQSLLPYLIAPRPIQDISFAFQSRANLTDAWCLMYMMLAALNVGPTVMIIWWLRFFFVFQSLACVWSCSWYNTAFIYSTWWCSVVDTLLQVTIWGIEVCNITVACNEGNDEITNCWAGFGACRQNR